MDVYEFEHYVASIWQQNGWDTRVTQASRDGGIDVVATKADPTPQKVVIQAKRLNGDKKVGAPKVQQYRSLIEQEPDADSVVIVTTGRFSGPARDMAERLNVKLIDGTDLLDIADGQGVQAPALSAHDGSTDAAHADSIYWRAFDTAMDNHEKLLELLVLLIAFIIIFYTLTN